MKHSFVVLLSANTRWQWVCEYAAPLCICRCRNDEHTSKQYMLPLPRHKQPAAEHGPNSLAAANPCVHYRHTLLVCMCQTQIWDHTFRAGGIHHTHLKLGTTFPNPSNVNYAAIVDKLRTYTNSIFTTVGRRLNRNRQRRLLAHLICADDQSQLFQSGQVFC